MDPVEDMELSQTEKALLDTSDAESMDDSVINTQQTEETVLDSSDSESSNSNKNISKGKEPSNSSAKSNSNKNLSKGTKTSNSSVKSNNNLEKRFFMAVMDDIKNIPGITEENCNKFCYEWQKKRLEFEQDIMKGLYFTNKLLNKY
jgi:hypothetical protein